MPVPTYKRPVSSYQEKLGGLRDNVKEAPPNFSEKELTIKKFGNPDFKREKPNEPVKLKRFGNHDPNLKGSYR